LLAVESRAHDVSALRDDWLFFNDDGVMVANHVHLIKGLIRGRNNGTVRGPWKVLGF
jgi:hypothetical protein